MKGKITRTGVKNLCWFKNAQKYYNFRIKKTNINYQGNLKSLKWVKKLMKFQPKIILNKIQSIEPEFELSVHNCH